MRYLVVILLCLQFYQVCFSQQKMTKDAEAIQVRKFEPSRINSYKSDPDFQYERTSEPPRSLWNRFWDWFWGKAGQLFGSGAGGRAVIVILVFLAIAILIFFIFVLNGMTNVGLFGKKNTGEGLAYSTLQENIHALQFDEAIQQAIADKNFRIAVRLLYLQSLKNLADRELINWQIDKTNVAYVQQLSGSKYQQGFQSLTFQFENNWYGNVSIDEDEFVKVRQQFNQFNIQLA